MVCIGFAESNAFTKDGEPVLIDGNKHTFCVELNNDQRKSVFETGILYITVEPNKKPKIET